MRIDPRALCLATGLTAAVLFVVCAAWVALAPVAATQTFSFLLHLDLSGMARTLIWTSFFGGLVGLEVRGWVSRRSGGVAVKSVYVGFPAECDRPVLPPRFPWPMERDPPIWNQPPDGHRKRTGRSRGQGDRHASKRKGPAVSPAPTALDSRPKSRDYT